MLRSSCRSGKVDISILSAAVQRCGQGRWWSTLIDILALQRTHKITSDTVHISAVMCALATCIRREGKFSVIPARSRLALQLGREVFDEGKDGARDALDFNAMLSSAFKLSSAINNTEARKWASELWEWSAMPPSQAFTKDAATCGAFLALCERGGEVHLVDKFLQDATSSSVNHVTLGSLLNAAADRCNAPRANEIWEQCRSTGVRPNLICYAAYAKAHMLAGSLDRSVTIINEMEIQRIATMNSIIAVGYGQCLLVVCHSSTSSTNKRRLQKFLARAEEIMQADERGNTKVEWKRIKDTAGQLLSDARKLRLQDVLIEWKVRTRSVMKDWPNFRANTNYLKLRSLLQGKEAKKKVSFLSYLGAG